MKSTEQKNKIGFLWFAIIAFALMVAAWMTLFIIASKHKVEEVPLEHLKDAARLRADHNGRKVAQTLLSVPARHTQHGTGKSACAAFPTNEPQWISRA